MKFKKFFSIFSWLLLLIIFPVGQTGAEESNALPKALIEQTSVEFPPAIAGSDVTGVWTIVAWEMIG